MNSNTKKGLLKNIFIPFKIEGIERYKTKYNMSDLGYQYFIDRIGILLDLNIPKIEAILVALKEVKEVQRIMTTGEYGPIN